MRLYRLMLWALILGAAVPVHAGEDDCPRFNKDFAKIVVGKSAADCEAAETKAYEEHPQCVSDDFKLRVENAKLGCVERLMEQLMEQRLSALAKAGAALATAEKRVQNNFRAATRVACQRLNGCDGNIYRIQESECLVKAYAWRMEQIRTIIKRKLAFDVPPDGEGEEKEDESDPRLEKIQSSGLGGYASFLCQTPAGFWAAGKPPAHCSTLVKRALSEKLGEDCRRGGEGSKE